MNMPTIRDVRDVIRGAGECSAGLPDGRYVPARVRGFHSIGNRLRATWLVFTGRADAVTWPGQ